MIADFRSDTVTRPTPPMLEAMMQAQTGDDVFNEDPTVTALERKAAELFGMEAGLFCPSGTMTNQLAVNCHTQPMEEILVHKLSHIYNYENGGYGFLSGLGIKLLEGDRGIIEPGTIGPSVNPDQDWLPKTSLLALENTVNKGGGSIFPIEKMRQLKLEAKQHGLAFHLDGARLFNAMVETGDQASDFGNLFDSISICLSKGLGAPVGSVLLGSKAFIKQARRKRKALGGGMRQAGILAAAGIYALDNHVNRLKEDHRWAKELESVLLEQSFVTDHLPAQTNIIMFEVDPKIGAENCISRLGERGVLCVPFGKDWVRMVTHLDIDDQALNQSIEVIKTLA